MSLHRLVLAEVRDEVAVRQHDALGEPGRAARERQRDEVGGRFDRRPRRGRPPRARAARRTASCPAASPIAKTSSTPAALRGLERPLGQLRHGDEKAGAGDAQLERGLLGRVESVHGRVRATGARDAVKRDGVLRHVRREDPDDLAGRQSARRKPRRAAIDVLGKLRVRQHGAADGIDDRRPLAARRRPAEHVVGERDKGHVHVRMRAADRHGRPDSTGFRRPKWQSPRVSLGGASRQGGSGTARRGLTPGGGA